MASGKSEALVALNHPRQLYEQGPGGRLLASVKAQTDYMVRCCFSAGSTCLLSLHAWLLISTKAHGVGKWAATLL